MDRNQKVEGDNKTEKKIDRLNQRQKNANLKRVLKERTWREENERDKKISMK